MNIELLLYTIVIPFVVYLLMSLNIEAIFKKGHVLQARLFFVTLTFIISYLLVGFIIDLVNITSFH